MRRFLVGLRSGVVRIPGMVRRIASAREIRSNRAIGIMALVAVVALIGGLALGHFVVSPASSAANDTPPVAREITAPIENRALANTVTLRGDVTFADSIDVTLDTTALSGPAVVTGRVPAIGDTFTPGSVALEVAGRPVIVLPGDLPVYRTLSVGAVGPDVTELKQALSSMGIDPGTGASDSFDANTAAAVAALYRQVGYPTPALPDGAKDALQSAEDAVSTATAAVSSAQHDLSVAQQGPSAVERLGADNAVSSAQRALDDAGAAGSPASQIADLQDALALATAQRAALLAPPDLTVQQAAVTAAQQQLASADANLVGAQNAVLPSLPAGEVLFLPDLPRRADSVTAKRGSIVDGPVMKVSGATVVISASASEADAKLLKTAATAQFAMPDGSHHDATVSSVSATKADDGSPDPSGLQTVLFSPAPLSPEQLTALQGQNVQVDIPVASTAGKVLVVPLAALSAGPGGESRIEVKPAKGGKDALVEVKPGLAADGMVQIDPIHGTLHAGQRVVVGR